MSERDHYPAGVPCWVETLQADPDTAMGFYRELFGWEFAGPGQMPGDPPGEYFVARLRGRDVAGVGSRPAGAELPEAWNTHISVGGVDEAVERARGAGAGVVAEPFDAAPAGRGAVLTDPTGAVFCVWEPHGRHGAQLINAPSAWAMSLLQSRDLGAAEAFYAEVFGWRAEPFGEGVSLMRLPGYVGGEPEQPVPRDVVAAITAAPDGLPESAWSVEFWIDDADGAAARAPALGGSVLLAPHDTPMFRRAVLADPAGVAFTIAQLVLPA